MNNVTTTNGNGKKTSQTLPDTRIKAAELFIENFQRREDELDRVKEELATAQVQIREQEAELEAMRRERVMLESRATTCLLQRDQAKDAQVSLATIINSIQRLIGDLGVPTLDEQAKLRALAQEVEAEEGE
jgi:hypothetical protein